MVRSCASEGGHDRIRESSIPGCIDKDSVKLDKSRRGLVICPGEGAIKEGNFNKAEIIYSIVKPLGIAGVKIFVGAFGGRAREVEVPKDGPRTGDSGSKGSKLSKESWLATIITGAVNVCNGER